MAIRNIRIMGDEVLGKICKPVKKMTPRTRQLIDDMFDTMYDGCGVGLYPETDRGHRHYRGRSLCAHQSGNPRDLRFPDRAGGLFKPPGKSRYCDPSGSCEGESPG